MKHLILSLTVCLGTSHAAAQELISVYTYHDHPPFINDQSAGLSHQLVKFLDDEAGEQFRFKLQVLPRKRLNSLLKDWISGDCARSTKCSRNWMIPWVNPSWGFGEHALDNFRWFKMFPDANAIISRADKPVSYDSPESLLGLRLGGMRGHSYVGIDPLVDANKIERIDGNWERGNVMMLLKGRVDAIILPVSTMNYYLSRDPLISSMKNSLSIAPMKHQEYQRHLMVPVLADRLVKFIQTIDFKDDAWTVQLQRSGVATGDTER